MAYPIKNRLPLVSRVYSRALSGQLPLPQTFRRFLSRISPRQYESLIRRSLKSDPYNVDLTKALIGLLLRSGRSPIPDIKIPATRGPVAVETLMQAAVASEDAVGKYAVYWQAILQHPQTAWGWAEFAKAFALRFDWKNARLAAQEAMARKSDTGPASAKPILTALKVMAEQSQLGDLEWREWFSALPPEIQATPEGAGLLVETDDPKAPEIVAQVDTRGDRASVESCLVRCMAAFNAQDFESAYGHLKRALELDLPYTLQQCVMRYSSRTALIVKRVQAVDDLADWLTKQPGGDDFTLMPTCLAPESILDSRRLRHQALERGLPSPILITLGKSASVSVANIFTAGFGLPTVLYSFLNQRVIAPWLADYLRGGACYTTHLRPSPENIELLASANAETIFVHVRDPRQQLVSMLEHFRRYPNQRERSLLADGTLDDEAALDEMIEKTLQYSIHWLKGWADASALNIHFTTFEEFVTDRERFMDRVLSVYGGETRWFDKAAALAEHGGIDYHHRKGSIDEWRTRLTAAQINRINSAIPSALWDRFGWTP